ncbi:MAG: carboxypeptidase regulatory-like domain-containing protein [Candidatus Eisenbacteria bacterium]
MLRSARLASLLTLAFTFVAAHVARATTLGPTAPASPGVAPSMADYRTHTEGVELDRIGIRFAPDTGARVRGDRLVSLRGVDLGTVEAIVAATPGARLERRFPFSEEQCAALTARAEARTLERMPDLNLFALVTRPAATSVEEGRTRLASLLSQLNAAPGVAEAWGLVKGEVATMPSASGTMELLRSSTPDFSPLQGYLHAPPSGFWADSVWTFPGGLGQGIQILGMEWGWLWSHEDFPVPFYTYNDQGPSDHGTATVGIFGSRHNGYGVSGIAGEASIGSIFLGDIAADILRTSTVLQPGDVFSMSIQVGGPVGWMPTEWWPDCFAAFQTVAGLGILGCQAAGNSTVDLDDPLYGGAFDPRVRNSGAFIIGAGTPNGLDAEWFSNYGSRVNLQGWGSSVVTTCCGDLQGGDPTISYTAGFNGTSSATPCVAGCLASLEGQAKAAFGIAITPALANEIMRATGSPQAGAKLIGPRPNLVAARARLLQGFGDVVVTVIDGDTQQPLPDWIVEIAETGRIGKTGPTGQIAMQLTSGNLTFHVPGTFYYEESSVPFTVQAGGQQAITLEVHHLPTGSIAGLVRNQQGAPIAGARVLLMNTPIAAATTDAGGSYAFTGVPINVGYTAVASNVPTKGAASSVLAVNAGGTTGWNPILVDATTFEANNGSYTPTNEWQWGTPTWPNGTNKPIPFSGTKVWGTDLAGTYDDLVTSVLTSPVYNLTGTHLTLSFHHWMWIANDDGGQVQVWDAAQNRWVVVTPVGGYPDPSIIILNYGPGYNGVQTHWEPAVFNLDQYAGHPFQFRFYFKSNFQTNGIGWYIDDVALDTGNQTVAVDLAPPSAARVLWAGPNPSAAASVIRFAVGTSGADGAPRGMAQCDLYNVAGALVRRLSVPLSGSENEIVWDGRDGRGQPVLSGVYLYRLTAGGESMSGRLLRVR